MREVAVRMPKFSMAQEDGVLLSWLRQEGDTIAAGDVLCEVATDKVNMEVESPVGGRIVRLISAASQTVPVGEPIAVVATEADDLLEGLLDDPAPDAGSTDITPAVPSHATTTATTTAVNVTAAAGDGDGRAGVAQATPPSRRGPTPAAPAARRRAAELGVDMLAVAGSGRGGIVTVRDVETAAQEQPEAAAPAGTVGAKQASDGATTTGIDPGWADALTDRRRSVRAAVARIMTESSAVPQFTAWCDLDLEPLARDRGTIGWTTLLVHALAAAIRRRPEFSAVWHAGTVERLDHVGVAIAADTPVGLLAPVLTDPDLVDVSTLDGQVRASVDRARSGRLTAADLDGATVTLSNLGGFGVSSFQALLTPPQAAALSVGSIGPQPVVLGGGLAIRTMCRVGLTVDHRVVDGADAGRLLSELRTIAADPSWLFGNSDRSRR